MKERNTKHLLLFLTLLTLAASCKPKQDVPPPVEELPELEANLLSTKLYKDWITGTTSESPLKDPVLPPVSGPVDWGKIAVSNEGEPLLFAVGTSITAGYREGGLFRQGQLTAYPNLIAHQMGLRKFNSGAFPPGSGNGTGYLKLVNSTGKPEYKLVTNDLAKKQDDPVRYGRVGQPVSNFGLPFLDYEAAGAFPAWTAEQLIPNDYKEGETMRYFMRYLPDNSEDSRLSPIKVAEDRQDPDLGFVEFGFTDYLGFYQPTSLYTDYSFYMNGFYPSLNFAGLMGKNAILVTIPEVRDLPYFKFVKAKERGFGIENYNRIIKYWETEMGNSVFDLYGLYKRIQQGGYTTDDGYAIDPSFRTGNFFSTDGLHPSAIGQAVIANELIKFINVKYESRIPLINVKEFARQFGK